MELSHVLTYLAESAAIALRADAAAVCLLNESGTYLSVVAVHGLPAELLDCTPQEIQSCALDREALTSRAAVVANAKHGLLKLPGQDFRAGLCTPLIHEGQPVGTLHVYATVPEHFSEDDAVTLRPLVDLGVAAIVATRAMVELKVLEANQAQFIRVTTHELRSPVTVAQSLVRGVLYAGDLSDRQVEVFTRIGRRLDGLENLINDLLDLAAGKALGPAEEGPVVLNASIGRVCYSCSPALRTRVLK